MSFETTVAEYAEDFTKQEPPLSKSQVFETIAGSRKKYYLPNNRWVNVAMNVTSMSSPTNASMAARTVRGSSRPIPPGKKPRP